METDVCYFRRRADEELAAAETAACDHSRAAHFEMAERYSQLAASIEEANEKLGPLPRLVLAQPSPR
jgi:hypothetical protein